MASVHRRKATKFWWAAFRQGGRLIFRSTGTTDKKLAVRIADDLEQAAKGADAGTLVESQVREILAGILKRAGMESPGLKPPSIRDFLEKWLESKAAGLSQGSLWGYQKAVSTFLEFMGARAKLPLGAVQPADARAFVAKLQGQGYAPKSVGIYAKVIRGCLRQAVTDGLIPSNPFGGADLTAQKAGKGVHKREPFTPAEIALLIAAAGEVSEDWRTVVMLGAYTGQRLRDCCRLTWENLNLTSGRLTFTPLKTGTELELPIHPALLQHLESLASKAGDQPAKFITPSLSDLETGGSRGLSMQFAEIMRKAGVGAGKVSEGTRRKQNSKGFHSLRHSFVSALANADVPAELRMKLAGHSDLKSHSGYTATELETLSRTLKKLPEF